MSSTNRWTDEEHDKFLQGLERYGRNWVKVSEIVGTRTTIQVRSHAQKYLLKENQGKRHDLNPQPTQRQRISVPTQSPALVVPDIERLRKAIPVLDPSIVSGWKPNVEKEYESNAISDVSSHSASTTTASMSLMAPPPARDKRPLPAVIDEEELPLPPPPAENPGLMPSCSSIGVDDDCFRKLTSE
jgi:SHAQKYF class myb-like DNA-binding protein